MKIYRERDYDAMSRHAAALIGETVRRKPDCVLGLATGSTPEGTYELLAQDCASGALRFRQVRTVNLDEYRGLAPTHDQSYRHYMQKHLFDRIDIEPANTHLPDGLAPDPAAECARYDALLARLGGADLQLLGLGRNGHIGFNEPGDRFIGETHVVDLSPSTIAANARFFARADEVPRQAITMGMDGILSARRVLLLVSGGEKAEALARAVTGPVTPDCPASILQQHGDVTVLADGPALELLIAKGVSVCES